MRQVPSRRQAKKSLRPGPWPYEASISTTLHYLNVIRVSSTVRESRASSAPALCNDARWRSALRHGVLDLRHLLIILAHESLFSDYDGMPPKTPEEAATVKNRIYPGCPEGRRTKHTPIAVSGSRAQPHHHATSMSACASYAKVQDRHPDVPPDRQIFRDRRRDPSRRKPYLGCGDKIGTTKLYMSPGASAKLVMRSLYRPMQSNRLGLTGPSIST